jgi:hypothetical protein
MARKKERGRPRLPAGRARRLVVRFLVSASEKSRLEAAARRENRTVSDWLRNVTLIAAGAASDQGSRPDPDTASD